MKKTNYTGTLHYLLVYLNNDINATPIGYGYNVMYQNKNGAPRQNITLISNDNKEMPAAWYHIKIVSEDVLVVVNRSIH
jgi:hypothetical protein